MTLHSHGRSIQDRQRGFLAVPLKSLRNHGQAARSLAAIIGVLRMDGRKTIRRQATIAKLASVSTRTFRRHCKTLEDAGVIRVTRRRDDSSVIELVGTEADLMEDGFIPVPRHVLDRPWSECVLLGWLTYRAQLSLDGTSCEDSLGRIARSTGLTRRSVINAVHGLVADSLIARETHLDGETGRFQLLKTPCLDSQTTGGAKMSAPRQSGEIVSAPSPAPVVKLCPVGGEIVSDKERRDQRHNYGPKKAVDRKCISKEVLAPIAAKIFKSIQYRGDQGRNIWKIGAASELGLISENELVDSLAGCRECRPTNRPAYLYAILKSHLAKRGVDLTELLRTVIVTPTCPTGPPKTPTGRKPVRENGSERTNEPQLVSEHLARWRALDAA